MMSDIDIRDVLQKVEALSLKLQLEAHDGGDSAEITEEAIAAIEQLQMDIFDLKADIVQAGNDACVMRGKINQLQAENEKAKTFMAWVDECRTHKPQHPDDEIAWIPRMLDWKQEAMALRSRVDELQAENADLKKYNETLEAELERWIEKRRHVLEGTAELRRQLDERKAGLDNSDAIIKRLRSELADLKARLSEILKERDEWQSLAERLGIDNSELRNRKD